MSKAMTATDWKARAQAYIEAAEHLGQSWTEERAERAQGDLVAAKLQKEADRCLEIAASAPQS